MLRLCICICALFLFCGCEKNWRGLMIEKRVYRDGYYVHLPWKRHTLKNEYPKPQPYPVDHSRTAQTDTTRKYQGGVATDSAATQPPVAVAGGGTGNAGRSPAPPPVRPVPPGPGAGPSPVPGATPLPPPTPAPPVAYAAPPELNTLPETDAPLYHPYPVAPDTSASPDSSVAVNDSVAVTPDSTIADNGSQFPDGEFAFIAELGFYNSLSGNSIGIKPASYQAGGAVRYTIHPSSRHLVSVEGGIILSHLFIRQDQHKQAPLFREVHDKERIMHWKARFVLLDHIYLARSDAAKVNAMAFGLFMETSLFSTHVAIDAHGKDGDALLTRSKTRLFGLQHLRRTQTGCTVRISNDTWSVFVNYRFGKPANEIPGCSQKDFPKVVVGVSRKFSC